MSSTYSGTETYHGSIVLPSDGDPAVAESVNVALRSLMDNSIVFRTDLGHVAADDRGNTSNIVGVITWNDSGGSFVANIPFELNGGVDINSQPLTIHTSSELACFATARFTNDVTVGNTGTDQFTVNSHSDFYGTTNFHEDVTIQSGDELTCHGPVTFDGPTTTIQSPSNQIGLDGDSTTTVSGAFAVAGGVNIRDDLRVLGNSNLGNSATDTHTVTGDVTMNDGLTVAEVATFQQGIVIDSGGAEVHGSSSFGSNVTINGNTTLGSNSSDTLTLNAQLASPMGFVGAGRVPMRLCLASGSDENLTPADGNVLFIRGSGAPIITLSNTDSQESDFWHIVVDDATATPTIQYLKWSTGTTVSLSMTDGQQAFLVRYGLGWFGGKWTTTEGS